MNSAILLAGYNNKRAVEKYSHIVEKDYGERYIETGYKPLHEFTVTIDGVHVKKPLLQFTLEVLIQDDLIEDIVIVGHKGQIEHRIGSFLASQKKEIVLIDQNTPLSDEIIEEFKLHPKETPTSSVGGNFIKGYKASRAGKRKEPALFVASDSPMTTLDFINRFLERGEKHMDEAGILLPAVYTNPKKDKLGRPPLLLINDTGEDIPEKKDKFGRNGFRLSSVLLADPHRIDVNMINVMYSLRKALNPRTQMRIFRVGREVGYPRIYNRYFVKKNLSIHQCEAICSAFFKGKFKAIPMHDIRSTYDFDGTEKEFIEISRMLDH